MLHTNTNSHACIHRRGNNWKHDYVRACVRACDGWCAKGYTHMIPHDICHNHELWLLFVAFELNVLRCMCCVLVLVRLLIFRIRAYKLIQCHRLVWISTEICIKMCASCNRTAFKSLAIATIRMPTHFHFVRDFVGTYDEYIFHECAIVQFKSHHYLNLVKQQTRFKWGLCCQIKQIN